MLYTFEVNNVMMQYTHILQNDLNSLDDTSITSHSFHFLVCIDF